MLEDVHLIEAALVTDRLVVALDERVRRHYRRACSVVPGLRRIVWVNPNRKEESANIWLRTGARAERLRMLGYVGVVG